MTARLYRLSSSAVASSVGIVTLFIWLFVWPKIASAGNYVEAPVLKTLVDAGKLAPIHERLPAIPKVVDLPAQGRKNGRHGGRIRMLMGREKDVRMMAYYGYSRLVAYNQKFEFEPDILREFQVEDGRIFTLHLRPGHKWSDGHPFTAEDFRFFWEDIANNKKLSRGGPHRFLLVDNKPPQFEVLDELTVRYTWHAPNPYFLSGLAHTRALYIFAPAHYLKTLHGRYASPKKLKKKWYKNFKKKSRQYQPSNPKLPTLEAWMNRTKPPTSLYVFERNPYFHRVDTKGLQLPYADSVSLNIGSRSLVPAKTGSGDSDLQGRYLRFDDYTFLKAAERQGSTKVKLWRRGVGSVMAIFPNLNTNDAVWRKIFHDANVRRALSLAINRREINQVIYYGLAKESANTVVEESPLYRKKYAKSFAAFDIEEANRLLDQTALSKKNNAGIRLLPDGRKAEIILETRGEGNEQTDVLSLIADTWRRIGILLYARPTHRDLLRSRVYTGDTLMAAWPGYNNAIPTADMSPIDFVPTSKQHYQWPKWGDYFWTKGKAGEAPTLPEAKQLIGLLHDWHKATTKADRAAIWHKILNIHAEQVFTIGTVNGTKQPIAHAPGLRNVPKQGIWNYFPGAYFGIYQPDTFFFDVAQN
ncbi:MAG: ABC transporter substrate-binding protein [Hyphomicrobiaceae bacterium]